MTATLRQQDSGLGARCPWSRRRLLGALAAAAGSLAACAPGQGAAPAAGPSTAALQGTTIEYWPFMEALPGFIPYYNFPTFWDARTAINTQLQTIWAGKATVRDGLAEAQRQAQLLLDKGLQGA